jgi:hypothetical protein
VDAVGIHFARSAGIATLKLGSGFVESEGVQRGGERARLHRFKHHPPPSLETCYVFWRRECDLRYEHSLDVGLAFGSGKRPLKARAVEVVSKLICRGDLSIVVSLESRLVARYRLVTFKWEYNIMDNWLLTSVQKHGMSIDSSQNECPPSKLLIE